MVRAESIVSTVSGETDTSGDSSGRYIIFTSVHNLQLFCCRGPDSGIYLSPGDSSIPSPLDDIWDEVDEEEDDSVYEDGAGAVIEVTTASPHHQRVVALYSFEVSLLVN